MLRALADGALGLVTLDAGDTEEALVLLSRARDTWLELAAPYPAAGVRIKLARAYAALGDAEGSLLELDAARQVFETLDAQPDLDRLARVAAANAQTNTSSTLSPREVQVLRLVARGKTNKEISAVLGVSSRTVDRHVSNVLAKLAVPSRAAATAHAYEHDLIN